jgi:murein DD-endopeptidase MepM/ murein hydrolase activator NlpD
VEPDPAAAQRIKDEAAMVSAARARRDNRIDYVYGFAWPATGRISGVYGSQRILNGQPGRPHYGLDIAAPTGSPVFAPADGIITLTPGCISLAVRSFLTMGRAYLPPSCT